MSKLILLVGMPGCGKGEFINAAKRHGYVSLTMGDIVREEAIKRGHDIRESGDIAKKLRAENGKAAVAILTLPKIEKGKRYIIDGIRGYSEVVEFRKHYDSLLVAIHAPPKIRFGRLSKRGRGDDPIDYKDFITRDQRELEFGIGDAIALADIVIMNEGRLDEFLMRSDEILKTLD